MAFGGPYAPHRFSCVFELFSARGVQKQQKKNHKISTYRSLKQKKDKVSHVTSPSFFFSGFVFCRVLSVSRWGGMWDQKHRVEEKKRTERGAKIFPVLLGSFNCVFGFVSRQGEKKKSPKNVLQNKFMQPWYFLGPLLLFPTCHMGSGVYLDSTGTRTCG
jgi:hypothetical protein